MSPPPHLLPLLQSSLFLTSVFPICGTMVFSAVFSHSSIRSVLMPGDNACIMDSMFVRGRLVSCGRRRHCPWHGPSLDASPPPSASVCPHLTRVSPLIFRQVALGDAQELPRGRVQGRRTKGLVRSREYQHEFPRASHSIEVVTDGG